MRDAFAVGSTTRGVFIGNLFRLLFVEGTRNPKGSRAGDEKIWDRSKQGALTQRPRANEAAAARPVPNGAR